MSGHRESFKLSVTHRESTEIILYLAGYLEDVAMGYDSDKHAHAAISAIKTISVGIAAGGITYSIKVYSWELDAIEHVVGRNLEAINAGVMEERYRVALDLLRYSAQAARSNPLNV